MNSSKFQDGNGNGDGNLGTAGNKFDSNGNWILVQKQFMYVIILKRTVR